MKLFIAIIIAFALIVCSLFLANVLEVYSVKYAKQHRIAGEVSGQVIELWGVRLKGEN